MTVIRVTVSWDEKQMQVHPYWIADGLRVDATDDEISDVIMEVIDATIRSDPPGWSIGDDAFGRIVDAVRAELAKGIS